MCRVVECAKLFLRVDKSHLCRQRDIDYPRLHLVLMAGIVKETLHIGSQLLRRELSIGRGQGKHLVSEGLHSSSLMHVDMCHFGSDDALTRSEQGVDHRRIGLCAANKEVDLCRTHLAGLPNLFFSLLTIGVIAVAGSLLLVRLNHPLQNLGLHPVVIIAFK